MIWFSLISVAVATSRFQWPTWPRWHRRVAPEQIYREELDESILGSEKHDQTNPLEATFIMDGGENFYNVPITTEGLSIRVLPTGVSLFNLYGLPPIRFEQFKNAIQILNDYSIPGIPSSIPPDVKAPNVKWFAGLWVINCYSDEESLIGSHIMYAFPPNVENYAVVFCDKLRGKWDAIAQLSESTQGWTGFYATYKATKTYEFATIDSNTSSYIKEKITTIIY